MKFESPPASLWGNVLTISTLLVLFGSALVAPLVVVVAFLAFFFLPGVMFTSFAVMFASLYLVRDEWPSAKKSWLFRGLFHHWRRFFALQVVMEDDAIPHRALFGCFPHGVFPLGLFLASSVSDEILPGRRVKGAIASAFFWVPLLGNLLSVFGCVPADAEEMEKHLRADTSVFLLPEGIAGIFQTSFQSERAFLRSRKGFVRLAMQTGASLVPVYVFGQSHLLSVLPGNGSFLEAWSRKLRVSLLLFFGDWMLPLPRAIPLLVVAGPSIETSSSNLSDEAVDAKHAEFCQSLIALFDRHKASYGWENKTLEIV